jgi:VanZ family protein
MTPPMRRLLRAGFYLTLALVAVLSLTPSAVLPPGSIGDKAEHVIAYAILGLLGGAGSERGMMRIVLGLVAFGIAIELLQAFSPGRSPDALDALADFLGACLGTIAAMALRRVIVVARHASATGTDVFRASVDTSASDRRAVERNHGHVV